MEFELSQFLDNSVEAFGGRANYYGTTYLYIVGEGLVPWQADVDPNSELKVGQPLRMVFRIKEFDTKRGFRRYFWKATPDTEQEGA